MNAMLTKRRKDRNGCCSGLKFGKRPRGRLRGDVERDETCRNDRQRAENARGCFRRWAGGCKVPIEAREASTGRREEDKRAKNTKALPWMEWIIGGRLGYESMAGDERIQTNDIRDETAKGERRKSRVRSGSESGAKKGPG